MRVYPPTLRVFLSFSTYTLLNISDAFRLNKRIMYVLVLYTCTPSRIPVDLFIVIFAIFPENLFFFI